MTVYDIGTLERGLIHVPAGPEWNGVRLHDDRLEF